MKAIIWIIVFVIIGIIVYIIFMRPLSEKFHASNIIHYETPEAYKALVDNNLFELTMKKMNIKRFNKRDVIKTALGIAIHMDNNAVGDAYKSKIFKSLAQTVGMQYNVMYEIDFSDIVDTYGNFNRVSRRF